MGREWGGKKREREKGTGECKRGKAGICKRENSGERAGRKGDRPHTHFHKSVPMILQ